MWSMMNHFEEKRMTGLPKKVECQCPSVSGYMTATAAGDMVLQLRHQPHEQSLTEGGSRPGSASSLQVFWLRMVATPPPLTGSAPVRHHTPSRGSCHFFPDGQDSDDFPPPLTPGWSTFSRGVLCIRPTGLDITSPSRTGPY